MANLIIKNHRNWRKLTVSDTIGFTDSIASLTTGGGGTDSQAGDIESLELIYAATNDATDPWYTSTGWAESGMTLDPAPFGVTVASIGGELRVTAIELPENRMIGELPEFPGLHEMTTFNVKQHDTGEPSGNQPERLTGALPASLGQTKCTHLILAGGYDYDLETNSFTAYNIKFGEAANQFTGGIPSEWGSLDLQIVDLGSQSEQFTATFEPFMSNWVNMKRFNVDGNYWHDGETGGSWRGRITKAAIGTWVNCDWFNVAQTALTGCDLDAFEDWNNIERSINFNLDGVEDQGPYPNSWGFQPWDQQVPDVSHLSEIVRYRCGRRGFSGEYPGYLHSFTKLREIEFTSRVWLPSLTNSTPLPPFADDMDLIRWQTNYNDLSGDLFAEADVSGQLTRLIMLFFFRQSDLGGSLPEGLDDMNTRYMLGERCNISGNLPNDCPGAYSDGIRAIRLFDNAIGPNFPANNTTWADAGINNEDESQIFDGGNFSSYAIDLSQNNLSDVVPSEWADMHITGGSGINVANNRLDFRHLINVTDFENNGHSWGLNYAPQKDFGEIEDDVSGDIIDISAYHQSGNVYVWRLDGSVVDGETSQTIDTSTHGSGDYQVTVTNTIAPDLTLTSIIYPI